MTQTQRLMAFLNELEDEESETETETTAQPITKAVQPLPQAETVQPSGGGGPVPQTQPTLQITPNKDIQKMLKSLGINTLRLPKG